ncbi:MAG: hypothetical protein GY795_34325 [Desulfobacterales bacterium]|nr:hypothetical protein [Desulfobacterales bacterium]
MLRFRSAHLRRRPKFHFGTPFFHIKIREWILSDFNPESHNGRMSADPLKGGIFSGSQAVDMPVTSMFAVKKYNE